MPSQAGSFTVLFEATPGAVNIDAMTGLSSGPAGVWSDQAVVVRFGTTGVIQALNGSTWAAVTSVPYSAGVTYRIRLVINVPAHTFSAYVAPAGGSEKTLATNYAFRPETNTVTSLDYWHTRAYTGTHEICDFNSVTNGSNTSGNWTNFPLGDQTGSFWAEFDGTPNGAGIDAMTGFSSGPAAAWADQAVVVRFGTTGVIQALNGSVWSAVTSVPYTASTTYHFRLFVNVVAHTYTAYVRPSGGTEVTLANNYAFRPETNGVTRLDHWHTRAYSGTHQTADFIASGAGGGSSDGIPPVISAVASAPASNKAAIMWTTNEGSNSSVDYGLSSGYGSTTPVQSGPDTLHTVLVTGLTPQQVYHYRVRSVDPAGNVTVSGDRTFSTSPAGTLAGFPGAQGSGATAVGGRGGRIYQVTNLNDAGGNSLRECVEASVARICLFRVGGTITLQAPLIVKQPYLTVAGQTAPGGGILLKCKNLITSGGCLRVQTNDVVLQYLRARVGKGLGKDALMFHNKSQRVVADHLSLSWATDENISVWNGMNSPTSDVQRDITMSWLLTAEALEGHAAAFLTGSQGTDANYTNSHTYSSLMTNIDTHHSMFSNHTHRAPLYKNKSARLVNNIIYNNDYHSTQLKGGISADIIGNVYKKGTYTPDNPHEINAFDIASNNAGAVNGAPLIHLSGNKGWNQSSAGGYQWLLARRTSGENQGEIDTIPSAWRRGAPLAVAGVPIIQDAADDIEAMLTGDNGVGASARLDCAGKWVGNRDAVDQRLMDQYAAGSGRYPGPDQYENPNPPFGWPTIAAGNPCPDTDEDGMPDTWETANGLDPNSSADQNLAAANGSGYTNLDMYLAGMRAR